MVIKYSGPNVTNIVRQFSKCMDGAHMAVDDDCDAFFATETKA
jgi:hypothetical protein